MDNYYDTPQIARLEQPTIRVNTMGEYVQSFYLGYIAGVERRQLQMMEEAERQRQRHQWVQMVAADVQFYNPRMSPGQAWAQAEQYVREAEQKAWDEHVEARRKNIPGLYATLVFHFVCWTVLGLFGYVVVGAIVFAFWLPMPGDATGGIGWFIACTIGFLGAWRRYVRYRAGY